MSKDQKSSIFAKSAKSAKNACFWCVFGGSGGGQKRGFFDQKRGVFLVKKKGIFFDKKAGHFLHFEI